MNVALHQAMRAAGFDEQDRSGLRTLFALRCVERVRHLVNDPRALEILDGALTLLSADPDGAAELVQDAEEIASIAGSHPGTNSMDGSGNAAVSATYAVAKAMAGDALAAAAYAAYAKVYAYASYAVTEPTAYAEEHRWQLALLASMTGTKASGP